MNESKKQKYKEDLKKIGNETLEDLEPVVKKGCNSILEFIKEIFNDFITSLFESRKKKRGTNEKAK